MPADNRASGDDFLPTASLQRLRLRAALLKRLRRFFDDRGFLEVDTPLLSADSVVDRHLDPLSVMLFDDARHPQQGRRLWLQTSPEFAMKRLLAAGAEAIYQVTHAFRAGETGARHNPEFTIAEWYRVGDAMPQAIQLLEELAGTLLDVQATERLSYCEAFQRYADVDPLRADAGQLAAAVRSRQLTVPDGWDDADRDAWLDLLLIECVEPQLGQDRLTVLYHYPAEQAALARLCPEDPRVAERFELYYRGIELANGYHELTDADVLRARNHQANRQRVQDGKYQLPVESRLLAAMEHGLPASSGVALGFDRIVMLAARAESLDEVTAFPIDRA